MRPLLLFLLLASCKPSTFSLDSIPACRKGFTNTAHKRKAPPDQFLLDLRSFIRKMPDKLIEDNTRPMDRDVFKYLGNYLGEPKLPSEKRAAMFELLRVSAAMESSYNWQEGRDLSASNISPETMESGIFQTSCNSHVYVLGGKFLRWEYLDNLMQKNGVNPRDCKRWIVAMKDESKKDMIFEHHAFMLRHNFRHYGPMIDHERVGKNLSRECMKQVREFL